MAGNHCYLLMKERGLLSTWCALVLTGLKFLGSFLLSKLFISLGSENLVYTETVN